MQADIVSSGDETRNTQATRSLLEEKYNALQILKKKLKIPSSEHVQSSELLALQEEKNKIHQEMMEYKGKTVKLQEEKNKWETERNELIAQISQLKKKTKMRKNKLWRN